MSVLKAKCEKCGFEQKGIFVYAYSGANVHLMYACTNCRKIISSKEHPEFCPDCKIKLRLYNEFHRDGYRFCPSCQQRKLKFSIQCHT